MIHIDTLRLSRKLAAAGLPQEAADAIAEGLADADTSELATKTGLIEIRTELKTEIAELRAELAELRAELKTDIAELRAETKAEFAQLYRALWMQGLGIVGLTVTLTVALNRLLS
jgi:predicted  nucleic acid-binding Zn-ribbon protein